MLIEVNGSPVELAPGSSLADLLELMQLAGRGVAVEVNLDIVPKASHDSHALAAGDVVEIVQFVGGG